MEKLGSLPVEVDALFLGYGHCQALKGLPQQTKVPVVMLEHEDCIAALIATERYHHEKNNGGITWFYPAGWAVNGMSGMIRLFDLDRKIEEGYEPEYFLKDIVRWFFQMSVHRYWNRLCREMSKELGGSSGWALESKT